MATSFLILLLFLFLFIFIYLSIYFTPTALGLPRWFPIQVLTRPDPAWFLRSDGIGPVQGDMAVDVFFYLNNKFF